MVEKKTPLIAAKIVKSPKGSISPYFVLSEVSKRGFDKSIQQHLLGYDYDFAAIPKRYISTGGTVLDIMHSLGEILCLCLLA